MPKLPDYRDAGEPGSYRSGRQVVSKEELSAAAVGRGAAKLGDTLSDVSGKLAHQQEAVDTVLADSQAKISLLESQTRIGSDPDWAAHEQRFGMESQTILNDAAARITNPQLREKWLAQRKADVTGTRLAFRQQADEKTRQQRGVTLEQSLSTYQKIYTDPTANETMRNQALSDIEAGIQIAETNGIVDSAGAAKLRDAYVRGTQVADVKTRLNADPVGLRRDLEGGRTTKPVLFNEDGSISTERTITVNEGGKWVNVPTIVGGKSVPDEEAVQMWRDGKNAAVGEFGSKAEAEAAAANRSADIGATLRGVERATPGGASESGLQFIREQESFKERAYPDGRQFSVGYGTKARSPNEVITREEAERRLLIETGKVADWVDSNISVPLTKKQKDALISFGYNLGTDDLDRLKGDINAGNFERVAERMLSFNRFKGQPLDGLTRRRQQEAALFLGTGAAPRYSHLSPQELATYTSEARREVNQRRTLIKDGLKDVTSLAEKGFAPRPEMLDVIRNQIAEIGGDQEAVSALAAADRVLSFQEAARTETPQTLDTFIGAERARLANEGATPEDAARVAMAETLLGNMRTELKSDPNGWADRTGVASVPPIDTSSPEAIASSIKVRAPLAESVGQYYGQAPVYLRPDEKRMLTDAVAANGNNALIVASSIANSLPPDVATKVLGELSTEAPELAMLGGLVTTQGVTSFAADAAEGMALIRNKEIQSRLPPKEEIKAAADSTLNGALGGFPKSESAAIALANAAYEYRAQRQGVTSFDVDLWKRGLREALGEREIGGEVYGGVVGQGWGSGGEIILPPSVKQESWRELIDAIQPQDLQAAGEGLPIGVDGRPVSLARIKGATFVQAGNGTYHLATGDPDTEGEELWILRGQPVTSSEQQYAEARGASKKYSVTPEMFVLDLNKLVPIIGKRRPDLVLMGRGETRSYGGGG